jgi:putative permease
MLSNRNPILNSISDWFNRNFSDPSALGLFFTIVFLLLIIEFFGSLLEPVIVSIVIAYLLDALVKFLEKWHLPHIAAVMISYCLFIAAILWILLAFLPLIWRQSIAFLNELPAALNQAHGVFVSLSHRYPAVMENLQLDNIVTLFKQDITHAGQWILSISLSTIPSLIQIVLYLVLVPFLVFFFVKDKTQLTRWCVKYLPNNQSLSRTVWSEVNQKISRYITGRCVEIIIVASISITTFNLLGLEYAFLMGALLGLSVLVPYIGVVVVTIPMIIMGLAQWGWSMHFAYLMIAYTIISTFDGNLLMPLLFSGVMDLHPVAIILAVLFFGAIWGFWGIFFSVPLATLVQSVLYHWPKENGSSGTWVKR